jgi:hypothetical protein
MLLGLQLRFFVLQSGHRASVDVPVSPAIRKIGMLCPVLVVDAFFCLL